MPDVNQQKANSTIDLCKLSALTINPRATDLRWKYRYDAWLTANLWKSNWDGWGRNEGQRFIQLLLTAATAKGFFSVWYNTFITDPDIKQALIQAFPGTHHLSFDAAHNFEPIARVAGDL